MKLNNIKVYLGEALLATVIIWLLFILVLKGLIFITSPDEAYHLKTHESGANMICQSGYTNINNACIIQNQEKECLTKKNGMGRSKSYDAGQSWEKCL